MKEIQFSEVLSALSNNGRPFPKKYYPNLSDLIPADVSALLKAWPNVAQPRKRQLLSDLNDLFEEDTLLNFEALATPLIKDADSVVRILALKLLRVSANPRLVLDLLKILRLDPEQEARIQAATLMGQYVQMGDLGELPDEKRDYIEEVMLEAAQGSDAAVARAALESLGFSGNPAVAELIDAAFKRADPLWQAAALFAAGRSGDARWQEQVLTGMLSEDLPVRLAAVQSAGELELKIARKPLLDMLEDEADEDVFQAIVWSLSQIGGEDVRTYLQALLDDTEDEDEIEFFEDALANLAFTEDMESFDMMAYDQDDDLDEGDPDLRILSNN